MAYFSNDAVNRVNLHSGIVALAQSSGSIFYVVFLLRVGFSIPEALSVMAAILAVRFMARPAILPLAKLFGLKPLLVLGTVVMAAQYPLLAEVDSFDGALVALCLVTALGEILYYPTYHAYFAAIGDAEHRGKQVGIREALSAIAAIIAPILGAWALLALGPRIMFAAVMLVQALSVLPFIGTPNVVVKARAPGVFRTARLGALLYATDGWFDASFVFVWQIALFVSLGENVAAYGGAMALAGLAGAAFGLLLGRHVDAGHGRHAVMLAYVAMAAVVLLRAVSIGSPWLAVAANALGPLAMALMIPPLGAATYNLAKASPCPLRFALFAEAGWDVGCLLGCLISAALAAAGVSLAVAIMLALPALAVAVRVLLSYFAGLARSTPARAENG